MTSVVQASSQAPRRPRLLVVVGPTAVGKTHIAIQLAKLLNGEIISADSRYLYRGMDIGTAKPTLAERQGVRHHLIDVTVPDQPWSLAEFQSAALKLIHTLDVDGRLPILVGGTGQYVKCILEGWTIPPGGNDPALRAELANEAERLGPDGLYHRLQEQDPMAASAIDRRNVRRVIRALEVITQTGQPFSRQRTNSPPDFRLCKVGLTMPREILYERIDQRIDSMIANGLVAEVERLAANRYDWSLPAMSAIGYQQIGMYLRGEIGLTEAIGLVRRATRAFVRRQDNWFKRNDATIAWYDSRSLDIHQLADFVRRQLEKQG